MIVMKFGGTSVAGGERMEQVVELVQQAKQKHGGVVVVLSAMSGVTNALIEGANRAVCGDLKGALDQLSIISARHSETIENLFGRSRESTGQHCHVAADLTMELQARINDLEVLYKGISYLGELSRRSLDAVSGMGELLSSAIVARLAESKGLSAKWLDAREFILTDSAFGRANPVWEELTPLTKAAIEPVINSGTVVFTQGFIAATTGGAFTTLGRGGSDYSASIIGVALDAEEIQIWTDVDGMMSADPRIVADAHLLPEVSFQEASELAYFGAKVLHPLTIKPAVEKKIPVSILNTLRPKSKGTVIKPTVESDELIRAVACKKNITAIFISSPKMLMSYGFLSKVFAVFEKYQTPIDIITTSEISVSLTIDQTDQVRSIVKELSEYGEVKIMTGMAIVSVVGRHYRQETGIAGQVFNALRDVNIIMISGGASDINITFVVAEQDADLALKKLHAEFFGQEAKVAALAKN
jgi:aspartate kinase